MRRPVVYISGPYSAPTVKERTANTRRAIEAAAGFWALGALVICPHANSHQASEWLLLRGKWIPHSRWLALDLLLIERIADIIYVLDGHTKKTKETVYQSRGCQKEIMAAQTANRVVFVANESLLSPTKTMQAWKKWGCK